VRELAKLRALTLAERRLLLFCFIATPVVSLAVATFGYRRVHGALLRWPRRARTDAASRAEALATARSVARVVAIAAGRGPIRATCLRRSLLVWWVLRRRGLSTALRVGVSREGGAFRAHAWVELDGVPLHDVEDVAHRFPAFEHDFTAGAERAS
jgi:hypothetical protein